MLSHTQTRRTVWAHADAWVLLLLPLLRLAARVPHLGLQQQRHTVLALGDAWVRSLLLPVARQRLHQPLALH